MPHTVFISYSRKNTVSMTALVAKLQESGLSVWVDKKGIEGAVNWSAEIVRAIDECSTFLLLLSTDSVLSDYVMRELHLASQKHKNILPVLLEKVELPRVFQLPLAGLQQVKYNDTDAILRAIRWIEKGHSASEQLREISPAHTNSAFRIPIQDSSTIDLAVLPFDDLSPAKDNEWFADGMMDELIYTLGALDKLRVPSRSDAMYYKRNRPKARQIADELNVRYLVEGSVRKAGDNIRLTVSLTDTTIHRQLWTNAYNGTFEDIFDFQESVSRQIAAALKLKLTPEEEQRITNEPTDNADAYELYLRAAGYHNSFTKIGFEKAIALYTEALSIDPEYTNALTSRAITQIANYRSFTMDYRDLEAVERDLRSAIEIGGITARTLWIEGSLAWQRGRFEEAESLLKRSIELDPKLSQAYNILGTVLMQLHKYSEAADVFEIRVTLSNDSSALFNLGLALTKLGDNERVRRTGLAAISVFEKLRQTYPNEPQRTVNLAFAYAWAGKKEEAIAAAGETLKSSNLDRFILLKLFNLYKDDLSETGLALQTARYAITHGYGTKEDFLHEMSDDLELQQMFEDILVNTAEEPRQFDVRT